MQPFHSLTAAEKHGIATLFGQLHAAIAGGMAEDDVAQRAIAFQQAYQGDSRPLVDAFGAADDKAEWARQVRMALAGELGSNLLEWSNRSPSVVPDDASLDGVALGAPASVAPDATGEEDGVVPVDAVCAHCGAALTVRCAPLPGHAVVTEHELTCPRCARLTTIDLPGAVVDVVVDTVA